MLHSLIKGWKPSAIPRWKVASNCNIRTRKILSIHILLSHTPLSHEVERKNQHRINAKPFEQYLVNTGQHVFLNTCFFFNNITEIFFYFEQHQLFSNNLNDLSEFASESLNIGGGNRNAPQYA